MTLNINVDNMKINIDTKQLNNIFKLISYFQINTFYRAGIEEKYYSKEIAKEDKIIYLQTYSKYFIAKYEKKNEEEASKYIPLLSKIENGLDYEQI